MTFSSKKMWVACAGLAAVVILGTIIYVGTLIMTSEVVALGVVCFVILFWNSIGDALLLLIGLVDIGIRKMKSKKTLKAPPGRRLRNLAEAVFSRKTYTTVFEPTLRDLYDEHREALAEGRPWKARRVRIRGYWSFWSAVFVQMPVSAFKLVYKAWSAISYK